MRKLMFLALVGGLLALALTSACGGGSDSSSASAAPATSFDLVVSDSGSTNFFELKGKKQPNLVVKAGTDISVSVTNKGKAIHNMRVAGADNAFNTGDDFVSTPENISPGAKATLTFKVSQPGTYKFRCDFHPDSTGTITAQ
jgi:plastocyanin